MDKAGWVLIGIAALAEALFVVAYLFDPRLSMVGLILLSLASAIVAGAAFWPGLDNFSRGSLVVAGLIWGFLVWGGEHNPQENLVNIAKSALLPGILIATVVVVWFLQRGET